MYKIKNVCIYMQMYIQILYIYIYTNKQLIILINNCF